jgi:hypothetical protein
MKVVVTAFGSSGDFNPLAAIAAHLVRRGIDVTFTDGTLRAARGADRGSQPALMYADTGRLGWTAAGIRIYEPRESDA